MLQLTFFARCWMLVFNIQHYTTLSSNKLLLCMWKGRKCCSMHNMLCHRRAWHRMDKKRAFAQHQAHTLTNTRSRPQKAPTPLYRSNAHYSHAKNGYGATVLDHNDRYYYFLCAHICPGTVSSQNQLECRHITKCENGWKIQLNRLLCGRFINRTENEKVYRYR